MHKCFIVPGSIDKEMTLHILIGLVVIVALIAWFYSSTQAPNIAASPKGNSGATSTSFPPGMAVAYLSGGKLFCKSDAGAPKQIFSPYITEVENRMARSKERNSWKQGTSFQVSASRDLRQFDGDDPLITVSSALFCQDRTLLYFLRDEGMGGLFTYDLDTGLETRLLHRQYLDLCDLFLDHSARKIMCTSAGKNGTSNIAMLDIEGNGYRELTGGDTVDAAPTWIGGDDDVVLYQSAGLARNREGCVVAQGHTTIQKLQMRSGVIDTVLESPGHDFMQPRVCADGNLYFIRRPYELPHYSSQNVLLDTLLFPFRLLRALFHYLNFFSLMYSRKPLTGASGPAVHADIKQIILKGRRIDAEKALREENPINGVPSLVPRTWELVKRNAQGHETVLATNVASYDLLANGAIVYSNGRAAFLLGPGAGTNTAAGNQPSMLLKEDLVADVVARAGVQRATAY